MKGFSNVLSSPSVCRRGAFGDLFLLKKWKTTDTGQKPSSMTLSFINDRSRIKTFRDDDNNLVWGGRTANTLLKKENDRFPTTTLGNDNNYYNGNDRSRIKALRDDGNNNHYNDNNGSPSPAGRQFLGDDNNDRSRNPAGRKTLRDDGLTTSVRTPNTFRTATAGFTLIELLVVVLIIGILAAVAVPQYEKVVEKTRAMEAVGLVRSVRHAQELYYMQNSRYASSLDSLTLSFPQSLAKNFHWDGPEQLKNGRFAISRSAEKYFYIIVASGDFRGVHLPGKIYCAAQPSNQKAVEICSEIGASEEDSDGSWRRFVIQ
ncbi:type IV pilin protein [Candidatus Avelusimicrobium sp.]|uniref:type IV pilin protein n=1 Tax=Candidatus Avelusimicrobium sp. TaxID=3048833 RepID=UPI003D7C7245